jgi:hypothetical protein
MRYATPSERERERERERGSYPFIIYRNAANAAAIGGISPRAEVRGKPPFRYSTWGKVRVMSGRDLVVLIFVNASEGCKK